MCSWQSCIHTVQRAYPALRKLWDGGGRFKNSCHVSTKSSTQANETVCHCFDSRLQHLVQNGISTGIQKAVDDTRLLALVWWSCLYFTYQRCVSTCNCWLHVWHGRTLQSINHSGNPSLKRSLNAMHCLGNPRHVDAHSSSSKLHHIRPKTVETNSAYITGCQNFHWVRESSLFDRNNSLWSTLLLEGSQNNSLETPY